MERLANALTNKLVKLNIVKIEDKELYVYGFWQGSILIINFLTIIVIGLLFKMLWQSLVFIISYSFLRPVAGGYHARKQKSCYILSIGELKS
ncbi:MAG: accessory gene regulator B family protein [Dysgonamonadaceae bacterium]|nr:accessory gene regulator B family protein [Dysgonamonadaceae bacterium]